MRRASRLRRAGSGCGSSRRGCSRACTPRRRGWRRRQPCRRHCTRAGWAAHRRWARRRRRVSRRLCRRRRPSWGCRRRCPQRRRQGSPRPTHPAEAAALRPCPSASHAYVREPCRSRCDVLTCSSCPGPALLAALEPSAVRSAALRDRVRCAASTTASACSSRRPRASMLGSRIFATWTCCPSPYISTMRTSAWSR